MRRLTRATTETRSVPRLVVAALSISVATCGGGFEVRPPCSAVDRDECWQIPRNEALHCDADARVTAALTQLGSFEHQALGDGSHVLFGPGTEEPTEQEHRMFAEEHLRFARAIDGVRWTSPLCHRRIDHAKRCLSLHVDHCTGPTLDVVAKYAGRWAKGLDMGHKRFPVLVHVGGRGPRCDANDPNCVPQPYDKGVYVPGVAREIIRQRYEIALEELPSDASPCEHDGDCFDACQDCASWVEPQGTACSQEYRTQLEHALCGCIGGHCSWFDQ